MNFTDIKLLYNNETQKYMGINKNKIGCYHCWIKKNIKYRNASDNNMNALSILNNYKH